MELRAPSDGSSSWGEAVCEVEGGHDGGQCFGEGLERGADDVEVLAPGVWRAGVAEGWFDGRVGGAKAGADGAGRSFMGGPHGVARVCFVFRVSAEAGGVWIGLRRWIRRRFLTAVRRGVSGRRGDVCGGVGARSGGRLRGWGGRLGFGIWSFCASKCSLITE